jgi:hypothetical protein
MDWHPICTAPRDGRWLLLAMFGGAKAHIGTWYEDRWEKDGEGLLIEPDVWMFLPEPPKEA